MLKSKEDYSRARWQIDADGFARSSGDRLLAPEELAQLPWKNVFRLFRSWNLTHVYDYEDHVRIGEALEKRNALPRDFALIPVQSWHSDVWTDITRMQTLNSSQAVKGKAQHLCPLQFDVVDRAIRQLSMPDEVVFDPFAGIGTVAVRAIRLGRIGKGVELNEGYWADMVAYCQAEENKLATGTLFDLIAMEAESEEGIPDAPEVEAACA